MSDSKLLHFPHIMKIYDNSSYIDNLGFPINYYNMNNSCGVKIAPNKTIITYWNKDEKQKQMIYNRLIKSSI